MKTKDFSFFIFQDFRKGFFHFSYKNQMPLTLSIFDDTIKLRIIDNRL